MYFILGLIRSTALYGTFCLVVSIFKLHIHIQTVLAVALHPANMKEYFLAFMIWSPVVLIVSIILHFIISKITAVFADEAENYFSDPIGMFVADFSNPWRGLVGLIGANRIIDSNDLYGLYCWFQVILSFLWSVVLLAFIVIGVYSFI